MNLTRREFLRSTTALAIGAGFSDLLGTVAQAGFPATGPGPSQPIIDTHHHLWDLDKFHLDWLKPSDPLHKNFLMADYLKAIDGLHVVKAVYVDVGLDQPQQRGEAEYVLRLCNAKAGPTVAAVLGGTPAAAGFNAYITQFKNNARIKGIRDPYRRGGSDDKSLVAGIHLLGELGMRFELIADSTLLTESANLAGHCPGTRFILNHCGNPDIRFYSPAGLKDDAIARRRRQWEDGISRLSEHDNIVCKISGVAESGKPQDATAGLVAPIVNHCIDRFGEDRVIFASNWPVCLKAVPIEQWVTLLREVTARRGEAFGRKLFHDNAERIYGLA